MCGFILCPLTQLSRQNINDCVRSFKYTQLKEKYEFQI